MDCKNKAIKRNDIIEIPSVGEITKCNAMQLFSDFVINAMGKIIDPDVYFFGSKQTIGIFWVLYTENKINLEIVQRFRIKSGMKNNALEMAYYELDKNDDFKPKLSILIKTQDI